MWSELASNYERATRVCYEFGRIVARIMKGLSSECVTNWVRVSVCNIINRGQLEGLSSECVTNWVGHSAMFWRPLHSASPSCGLAPPPDRRGASRPSIILLHATHADSLEQLIQLAGVVLANIV
jgi:hypothetical protein